MRRTDPGSQACPAARVTSGPAPAGRPAGPATPATPAANDHVTLARRRLAGHARLAKCPNASFT